MGILRSSRLAITRNQNETICVESKWTETLHEEEKSLKYTVLKFFHNNILIAI